MNYVTYDESGALTGSYAGQEPQEGQDRYFELLEPLEQHWTAYRMSDARDGLELLPAPAPTEPPAPAPLPRHITKLAFRNRFTTAEKVMIDLASIDDPAADMVARQQAAAVRVAQADAAAATYIDLDRADTRDGVTMLETAGILGAGRALEILDAEIFDIERVPA
jgi:hypothetical protein